MVRREEKRREENREGEGEERRRRERQRIQCGVKNGKWNLNYQPTHTMSHTILITEGVCGFPRNHAKLPHTMAYTHASLQRRRTNLHCPTNPPVQTTFLHATYQKYILLLLSVQTERVCGGVGEEGREEAGRSRQVVGVACGVKVGEMNGCGGRGWKVVGVGVVGRWRVARWWWGQREGRWWNQKGRSKSKCV